MKVRVSFADNGESLIVRYNKVSASYEEGKALYQLVYDLAVGHLLYAVASSFVEEGPFKQIQVVLDQSQDFREVLQGKLRAAGHEILQ